jgi:hypothetical protein
MSKTGTRISDEHIKKINTTGSLVELTIAPDV